MEYIGSIKRILRTTSKKRHIRVSYKTSEILNKFVEELASDITDGALASAISQKRKTIMADDIYHHIKAEKNSKLNSAYKHGAACLKVKPKPKPIIKMSTTRRSLQLSNARVSKDAVVLLTCLLDYVVVDIAHALNKETLSQKGLTGLPKYLMASLSSDYKKLFKQLLNI